MTYFLGKHFMKLSDLQKNSSCIVFHMQIRQTQNVSVFKVAFASRLKFEGPKCLDGRVVSWHTSLQGRYVLHHVASFPDQVCTIPRAWE